MTITVETTIAAPLPDVWHAYLAPADIMAWNAASADWHTTAAAVDLRVGGAFSSRMEAKDGSFGFDFSGTYTAITPHRLIEYDFGDRHAKVDFLETGDSVTVRIAFDPESEHPIEMQREGWQAILDSFARHVVGLHAAPRHELMIDRVLNVAPAQVFACWANGARLKQWWVPAPWSCPQAVVDFRTGGSIQAEMRGPDGERVDHRSVFLEVIDNQRIVFTDAFSRPWQPSQKPFITAIIDLIALPGGKTRYLVRVLHWSAEDRDRHAEMGFIPGWNAVIDQIEILAKSL